MHEEGSQATHACDSSGARADVIHHFWASFPENRKRPHSGAGEVHVQAQSVTDSSAGGERDLLRKMKRSEDELVDGLVKSQLRQCLQHQGEEMPGCILAIPPDSFRPGQRFQ